MTTGIFYPAASSDDGYAIIGSPYSGFNGLGTNFLILGDSSGAEYHTFIRFANITIPQGATIIGAFLRFKAYQNNSTNTANVDCFFEAADNPAAPSSAADLQSRSLTTNFGDWNALSAWVDGTQYDSPSLVDGLQEVVDREGYPSSGGGAIIAHLKSNNSSIMAYRLPSAFDYLSASELIELHVEWEGVEPLQDDVGLDDEISAVDFKAEIIDGAGLGDQFEAFTPNVLIEESTGLNDSFDVTLESPNSISDDAGLGDSIVSFLEIPRSISDQAGLGDEIDAFNWSKWLAANKDRAVSRFYFTLTGAADGQDDIELKASSIQARKRDGEPTYLQVTVPVSSTGEEIDAVVDRPNGDMVVELAFLISGQQSVREEILRAHLQDISQYRGGRNRSIILTGYQTTSFVAKSSRIENPIYYQSLNGRLTYRFAQIDPYVNPGDTCLVGEDSFRIDYVSYSISPAQIQMEVHEV